jgi:outer membrane receptor protein involved in Fe transport
MTDMRHLALLLASAAISCIPAAASAQTAAADDANKATHQEAPQGDPARTTAGQPVAVPGTGVKTDAPSDAIIVTGVRASLRSAQQIKRNANQVVDSIVAEDIGKLPDNTVSDALQRVTGIQVQRGGGEASTVLIRGLPRIQSLVNGREVFTGTGRGVALADIPAELVAGIDVYKTTTPELIEGSISGLIDIRSCRTLAIADVINAAHRQRHDERLTRGRSISTIGGSTDCRRAEETLQHNLCLA